MGNNRRENMRDVLISLNLKGGDRIRLLVDEAGVTNLEEKGVGGLPHARLVDALINAAIGMAVGLHERGKASSPPRSVRLALWRGGYPCVLENASVMVRTGSGFLAVKVTEDAGGYTMDASEVSDEHICVLLRVLREQIVPAIMQISGHFITMRLFVSRRDNN
jgi:hypothetical protein